MASTDFLVIDTSVFVSSLGKPDAFSLSSQQFFQHLQGEDLIIPTLVIAETIASLCRQIPIEVAEVMLQFQECEIVDLKIQELEDVFESGDFRTTQLKASDLLIALTTAKHNATLITWDRALLQQGKKLCPTMTPEEFVKRI